MTAVRTHSRLCAAARLAAFLCVCAGAAATLPLVRPIRNSWRQRLPRFWHGMFCRAVGLKVVTRGEMRREQPTLFAANHVSYLDILALGSLVRGTFVAKQEIAGWPFFGFMTDLQRTIYVDRRTRYAAGQRDALSDRLADGESIILFAESTSSDGLRVLPFKSALFAVAQADFDGQPLAVQPVSIAYTRLDGIPLGRHLRPLVAWYGDMELTAHGWVLLGLGRLTVEIEFHAPVTFAEFGSRKALAAHCQRVVAGGVAAALAGRRQPALPAREDVPEDVPEDVDLQAETPATRPSAA